MKLTKRLLKRISQHGKELEALGAVDGIEAYNVLCRIEKRAHKLAEDLCNMEIPEEISDKRAEAIKSQVSKVFGGKLPAGFFINYDPRGYALKIKTEENKLVKGQLDDGISRVISYTDLGDYGILAPEFDN